LFRQSSEINAHHNYTINNDSSNFMLVLDSLAAKILERNEVLYIQIYIYICAHADKCMRVKYF
jgi:hypothetical protein